MGLKTWLGLKESTSPRIRPGFAAGFEHIKSRSQLFQDLWVLSETGGKRGGFFVEIGAFDGKSLSNTYALEKNFRWTGILVEPNPRFGNAIRRIRSAALVSSPVDATSGREVTMLFVNDHPELSGMEHAFGDNRSGARENSVEVRQRTISLNDLLAQAGAPKAIDFMSIDTEGSEPDILSTFDFDRYSVQLFAVEHNNTPADQKLDEIIIPRGYERVHREWSQWDAWYRRL